MVADSTTVMACHARCCECSFWVKYSLFCINFLVWTSGVILMVIGAWAQIQNAHLSIIDPFTKDPTLLIIIVGVIMFVTSIFGCIGSIRESVLLLKIYIIVIVVIFILEIIGGILAFVFLDHVEGHLLTYLRTSILGYQRIQEAQNNLDYIQQEFECCGSSSYQDWERNLYFNCSSPSEYRCGVPMSCCRNRNSIRCGFQTRIEGEVYASNYIFTRGCLEILMSIFEEHLVIVGFIAFGVGIIELCTIVMAHVLIKYIIYGYMDWSETSKLSPEAARKLYAATNSIQSPHAIKSPRAIQSPQDSHL